MTEPSDLAQATQALADALVAVWEECERGDYRFNRGTAEEPDWVNAGPNLSECLSVALAIAAKALVAAHPDEDPVRLPLSDVDTVGHWILVKHRPGCWEAQHVVNLVDLSVFED